MRKDREIRFLSQEIGELKEREKWRYEEERFKKEKEKKKEVVSDQAKEYKKMWEYSEGKRLEYKKFLEDHKVDEVYEMMNEYREKFGMKRDQLEFVDEKFKGYKKFNDEERKRLEEETKELKDYREFLDKNDIGDVFKMMVEYRDKLKKKDDEYNSMWRRYNDIIIFREDKEKKLNKRIDKLEEEKKGLEEEICRMKLGF